MEIENFCKTINILTTPTTFNVGSCKSCDRKLNYNYLISSSSNRIYYCNICDSGSLSCEDCFNKFHSFHRNLTELYKIKFKH